MNMNTKMMMMKKKMMMMVMVMMMMMVLLLTFKMICPFATPSLSEAALM